MGLEDIEPHKNRFLAAALGEPYLPTTEEMEAHKKIRTYDNFELTGAIAPDYNVTIKPTEGYRCDTTEKNEYELTALMTRHKIQTVLLEVLHALPQPLLLVADRFTKNPSHLTTKHPPSKSYGRAGLEMFSVEEAFDNFGQYILEDGYMGLYFYGEGVQENESEFLLFDEHKILHIWTKDTEPFEDIFAAHGIQRDDAKKDIDRVIHFHMTPDNAKERWEEFIQELQLEPD